MTTALHRIFSRARLDDRQVNELVGLAHGIVADGVVTQQEAEYLQKWLVANSGVSNNPVVANLLQRVNQMLSDRVLDADESRDLLETLTKFSGGDFELGEVLKSSSLPLDEPPPEILFDQTRFCFTGTFAFGSRQECEDAVERRGATAGLLTLKTDYLVIGIYATESWIHSSYGRKIERAVELKEEGVPVSIIGEAHWVEFLSR